MGMYDTFRFKCPNCEVETDAQTKMGECCLDNWTLGSKTTVPDGHYRVKDNCHKCGFFAFVEIKNGIFWMVDKFPRQTTLQDMPYGGTQKLGADPDKQIKDIANALKKAYKEVFGED
jgi:hypothetical protein